LGLANRIAPAAGGQREDRDQQRHGFPAVCLPVGGDRELSAQCPRRGQAGHGRWHYDAHVPGPDGRQKRLRQGGFMTRATAEQGLAAVLELDGPDAMAETWTIKRWPEYWLSLSEDRLRPSTLRAYRSVTRAHLIPWLGRFRVADLDGRRGRAQAPDANASAGHIRDG
jgi:hypothetical protein